MLVLRTFALVLMIAACGNDNKRVFTTNLKYDGNLGGLAGADAKCQQAATAATLGGQWKAWLSDSNTNAIDRIADVGPWERLDGTVVFNNHANLATLPIDPLNIDENGTPLGTAIYMCAWTGTGAGGMKTTDTCNNWTSAANTDTGDGGDAQSDSEAWTRAIPGGMQGCGRSPCDRAGNYRLYCFEQ